MIAYKVVTAAHRESFLAAWDGMDEHHRAILRERGFVLRYKRRATIHAHPRSAGIFCFKHPWAAEDFIRETCTNQSLKVIKVRGEGVRKSVMNPCKLSTTFFSIQMRTMQPPRHTIQFSKVKVLT